MRARRTSMAPGYVRSFGSSARDRVTRARPGPPPTNVIRYTVRARAVPRRHRPGRPLRITPMACRVAGAHNSAFRFWSARQDRTCDGDTATPSSEPSAERGAPRSPRSTVDRRDRPRPPRASTVPAALWASRSQHIPPRGQADSPPTRTCAVARCPATRHPKQRTLKHPANERLRESRAVYGLSITSLIGRASYLTDNTSG